jgi:hypothetical protein
VETIELLKLMIDGSLALFIGALWLTTQRGQNRSEEHETQKDLTFLDLIQKLVTNIHTSTLMLQGLASSVEEQGSMLRLVRTSVEGMPAAVQRGLDQAREQQLQTLNALRADLPEAVRARLLGEFQDITTKLDGLQGKISELVQGLAEVSGDVARAEDKILVALRQPVVGEGAEPDIVAVCADSQDVIVSGVDTPPMSGEQITEVVVG